MFTIVKYPQIQLHRRDASEPRPEIINHRNDPDSKRWSEKLRNEEITYKHLKQHRDELLESEIRYKKTIKQLEKEKEELIKVYEPTYNENKVLKSLLEHGPDAVKMKKLRKARKELGDEVDTLKDENKRLTDHMQELIKKHAPARDDLLEKNWQDVLAESKKTKERNEVKVTQGPFLGKDNEKSKVVSYKETMKDDDEYDLQLDTVEKEIQILLNNVKYIKKQKEKLDYATLMNKGAIVKNSVLEKAIYDKLDEDLLKFKSELDIAKSKHDDIKEQLEQKEKNKVQIKKKEIVDNSDNKTSSEKTMVIEQLKTYATRETQTEVPAASESDEKDKVKKKRTRRPNASIAVQTDLSSTLHLVNIKEEAMKYIELYENKKSKMREAYGPEKVSSTQIRRNYAKKLVVRREESPDKEEKPNNIPKHINKILLERIEETPKKTERPLNTQKKKKSLIVGEGENFEEVERSTNKQQKTNRYVATIVDEAPSKVEKSENNLKQGKNKHTPANDIGNEAETTLVKSNKEGRKTNTRTHHTEGLPKLRNTSNPNTHLDVPKSKDVTKSSDVLNQQQDLFDYENMIMNPRTDIRNKKANAINSRVNIRKVPKSKFEKKPNDNHKLSRIKSKSSADINLETAHSERSARKHRLPVILPSKDRISVRPDSVDSWKSESDLPIFSESETESVKPFKDLKLPVKKKNNYINRNGVLYEGCIDTKRDVSAYDKVLHDLQSQQKEFARDVSQDFKTTVNNFRENKGFRRKGEEEKRTKYDNETDLLPQALLTFTELPYYKR